MTIDVAHNIGVNTGLTSNRSRGLFAARAKIRRESNGRRTTSRPAYSCLANASASWLNERGSGNDEKRKITEQVCDFIDRHGDARFSNANEMLSDRSPIIRDRAGWWKDTDDGRVYLFTSSGMREALTGIDFSRGLDALQDAGMLPPPKPGSKRLKSERIAGHKGTKKVYPITTPTELTKTTDPYLEVSIGGEGRNSNHPPG